MKRIAILITVFNRIQNTRYCLERLYAQETNAHFDVFLVNDGSTDNTERVILEDFPKVHLIKGSGDLYWNRGMCLAWEKALQSEQYDSFIWLNNDTFLLDGSLKYLLKMADQTNYEAILCGSIASPHDPTQQTYGGGFYLENKLKLNYPNGKLNPASIINGNCVLIPFKVYEKLGTLDKTFTHAMGDFDYGLRAVKKGIPVFTTDFVATCEKNISVPVWCNPSKKVQDRWKNLYHPLGRSEPDKFFIYSLRHFGLLNACKVFFSQHLRMAFPSIWKSIKKV